MDLIASLIIRIHGMVLVDVLRSCYLLHSFLCCQFGLQTFNANSMMPEVYAHTYCATYPVMCQQLASKSSKSVQNQGPLPYHASYSPPFSLDLTAWLLCENLRSVMKIKQPQAVPCLVMHQLHTRDDTIFFKPTYQSKLEEINLLPDLCTQQYILLAVHAVVSKQLAYYNM